MAVLSAYVRKTGSDNNGGSSSGTSPDRTGTDGVTAGTTTFTSVTASFTSGDVDKLINIVTKGRYRIATYVNSTTVTISGSPSAGSGLTWNLGGAVVTIGAILANTNSIVTNGDSVHIGAGVYREVVTIGISPTAEVIVAGDSDGTKTGDAGEVQWTAYTTNDETAPSSTALLTMNGKDFLTFRRITFMGGNAAIISTSAASTDINFTDCTFLTGFTATQNFNIITIITTFAVTLNWTIDRCRFLNGARTAINITLPTGTGADYDVNFVIKNCLVITANGTFVNVTSSGTSANEGGGVDLISCTHFGTGVFLATGSTRNSLTYPCTATNCFIYTGTTGFNAAESGAITEDYNLLVCGATPRTNVTAGGNSISDGSVSPLIFIGQELQYGANLRPFAMPTSTSPLLNWGNGTGVPSVDIMNRIRPAGGGATLTSVGAYEYHDSAVRETSTVRTGSNAIKFVGAGDHDFDIPVDATSTTVTIYGRFDGTYAGTKPQMKIVNGTECGVADATAIMTGSSGAWEQLSLNFTPTAKGIITIRLISNSTAGAGIAFFDDFAVS